MDINKQLEIIRRGAVQIISEALLEAKLKQGRPLVVKAGFDPTAPDIHLGHTVLLRKMRQFQDLGHKVVFLIGDFTGRIGDPSGRSQVRKQLTPAEAALNAETYKQQVSKVLDLDKIQVRFNSEWFDKMSGFDFVQLFTHYTATRLLERDDFSKRLKENKPLYMLELMYPVLQGYDSVMLEADVELGGTDQVFNLLVGRDLQRDFHQKEQAIITMPLLEGTDGAWKMSKSYGNYIGINETASDMFGKIMSISDELMLKYYELLTDEDLASVRLMHPKEAKMHLARAVIKQYHSEAAAQKAQGHFQRVFSQKQTPEDIAEYKTDGTETILNILTSSGLVKSGNEARRLIRQGAVTYREAKIQTESFLVKEPGVLKAGSRRFLKIVVQ